MNAETKPNIKDLSFADFSEYLGAHDQPLYRAKQVWQWLYKNHAIAFGEMTNLAKDLRHRLEQDFVIGRLSLVRQQHSNDGTVKFLFGLADGESVESVLIPEKNRLTLCISSQVGCAYNCAFCATARLGFKRNLRAGEIVEQVVEASRALTGGRRITNIVLMGMGEPLANYDQTVQAIEILNNATWGLGISPRRITVSSVGLVPQIEKLIAETNITLAISLHAPTEDLRGQLMPVNRKYSLRQLIDCCRALPLPKRKRITFEYVLLRSVNDREDDAAQLADLLRGVPSKINLIPFNPHPGSQFQRPVDDDVVRFQNILRARGLQTNIRRPRGDDIQAACGQLQGEEAGKVARLRQNPNGAQKAVAL